MAWAIPLIMAFLLAMPTAQAGENNPLIHDRLNEAVDRAADELVAQLREKSPELFAENAPGPELGVFPVTLSDGGVLVLGQMARERMTARLGNIPGVDILGDLAFANAGFAVKGRTSPPLQDVAEIAWIIESRTGDMNFDYRILASASSRIRLPSDRTSRELMMSYVHNPKGKKTDAPVFNVPPLSIRFDVAARRRLDSGRSEDMILADGGWLSADDQFRVCLRPNSDCHAYVFLRDSQGHLYSLFPSPGISLSNELEGGLAHWIPEPDRHGGVRWFYLDDNVGTETLYVVASREPIGDVDRLLAELAGTDGGDGLEQAMKDWAVGRRRENNRRFNVVDAGAMRKLDDIFPVVEKFTIEHRRRQRH